MDNIKQEKMRLAIWIAIRDYFRQDDTRCRLRNALLRRRSIIFYKLEDVDKTISNILDYLTENICGDEIKYNSGS